MVPFLCFLGAVSVFSRRRFLKFIFIIFTKGRLIQEKNVNSKNEKVKMIFTFDRFTILYDVKTSKSKNIFTKMICLIA